jgi:hypothetical protein
MSLLDQLSIPADALAHHEAGHAVAATVLGIPYLSVSIIPYEDGTTGVRSKRRPWTFPRPDQKLNGLTDDEWAELVRDDAKWEAWQKQENDEFAIYMLAGKAAQKEFAGFARPEDAKFDYSLVQSVLPHCYARLEELEQAALELMRRHWPAVQAVAAELIKRSQLTPAETEAIIVQAMPTIQIPRFAA